MREWTERHIRELVRANVKPKAPDPDKEPNYTVNKDRDYSFYDLVVNGTDILSTAMHSQTHVKVYTKEDVDAFPLFAPGTGTYQMDFEGLGAFYDGSKIVCPVNMSVNSQLVSKMADTKEFYIRWSKRDGVENITQILNIQVEQSYTYSVSKTAITQTRISLSNYAQGQQVIYSGTVNPDAIWPINLLKGTGDNVYKIIDEIGKTFKIYTLGTVSKGFRKITFSNDYYAMLKALTSSETFNVRYLR